MDQLNRWNAASGGAIAISGWILTLLALILTVVFYRDSRQPRRFGWQILSLTEVWNPELDKLPHKVPLKLVSGTTAIVGPANVIILRLGNAGRMTVEFSEKLPPVQIKFNKATLVDARIVDSTTSDIVAKLLRTSQSLTLRPSVLQRRQWLELLLITEGEAEYPNITATVKDETASACNVQRLQLKAWWLALLSALAIFFVAGAYILALAPPPGAPPSPSTPAQALASWVGVLSMGLFAYGIRAVATKFRWAKKRS
jgi:hypothetical protein